METKSTIRMKASFAELTEESGSSYKQAFISQMKLLRRRCIFQRNELFHRQGSLGVYSLTSE